MRDEDLPPPPSPETGARFERLVRLIAKLRAPGGCPWDREQTHQTLKPMTLEEAYEVLEAIDAGDPEELRSELGDLLLQVVFHADMAQESGTFDVDGVVAAITDKMVRRHPHVFGDVTAADGGQLDTDTVLTNWDAIKRAEKGRTSVFEGIAHAQPSLAYADAVQRKAAKVGFDWPDVAGALPKIAEEAGEVVAAADNGDELAVHAEIGDLLFAVVNVARHLGVEPETALRAATDKFRHRFEHVERLAAERGIDLHNSDLDTLDRLWDEVKASAG